MIARYSEICSCFCDVCWSLFELWKRRTSLDYLYIYPCYCHYGYLHRNALLKPSRSSIFRRTLTRILYIVMVPIPSSFIGATDCSMNGIVVLVRRFLLFLVSILVQWKKNWGENIYPGSCRWVLKYFCICHRFCFLQGYFRL